MSFQAPTTSEISENIVSQISAALNQSIPLLPKSFVRVLAKALAGVYVLLYKRIGWNALQMFVRTASFQLTNINGKSIRPLVEWGVLVGAGEPTAPTRAELNVTITVRDQTGTLEQGRQLVNTDTGVTYVTTSAVALDAPTKEVIIRAVGDQAGQGGRGVIGNMQSGDTLEFASPPARVAREVTVVEQTTTGADEEDEDAYRARVIRRFRQRPQGGAYADYEEWATEVPGIIGAFPYTGNLGEVNIYCEATEESSGSVDGIPTAAQLEEVVASIEFRQDGRATRRPANAFPSVISIIRTGIDVTIIGLDVDDPATVEQAVEDACDEYLRSLDPFIAGLSVLPRRDVISNPELSGIVYAVVTEAGGIFERLELEEAGTVFVRRTLGEGEKAKLNTITFVTS
jgi:uncharacterized phage protein gp47/JayE